MHPLETVDWRLKRANQHLATLNRARKTVVEEKNRSIIGEFDRNTTEYVFRFAGKLPDPRLGIIVGEFAHQLRSALDNLLWQLVLLRGGSPTTKTQYPIYESRERYQSSAWMLRGVSADDRALIERTQPYQLGERAPHSYLSLLTWLNNVDKHRYAHVGSVIARTSGAYLFMHRGGGESEPAGQFPWHFIPTGDIRKVLSYRYITPGTSDDRTELLRVKVDACGPDPQMKMQSEPPVEIAMSDVDGTPVLLSHLSTLRNEIVGLVECFRPRFDIVGRTY